MAKYPCPCCGSLTLTDPGGFEICQVCGWEDDGQDDSDADVVCGGPNGNQSLTEARRIYAERAAYEAMLRDNVRRAREGTDE